MKYAGFPYKHTITTCVKNLAFGFFWKPGEGNSGSRPYLCPYDEEKLANEFSAKIDSGNIQEATELLKRIQEVAQHRNKCALEAFGFMHRRKLHQKYFQRQVPKVGYNYLYGFTEKYRSKGFKIAHMDEIDSLRIGNACPKILRPWYISFILLKQHFRDDCIFGADEMGIELSSRKLNFLTKKGKRITLAADKDFPHTTVMFCHSMGGASFPAFVIMQSPKENNEIRDLLKIGLPLATNSSGWMTEPMFALWCLFFSCQLSQYKFNNRIGPNEPVLLILDGHTSRSNVLGLEILKQSRVEVITLMSHTSHVSQMFDVQLASSVKLEFSKSYKGYLTKFSTLQTSNIQKQRLAMMYAIRDSWGVVATPVQCKKSAETAGYCVTNEQEISKFFESARVSSDELASQNRQTAILPSSPEDLFDLFKARELEDMNQNNLNNNVLLYRGLYKS